MILVFEFDILLCLPFESEHLVLVGSFSLPVWLHCYRHVASSVAEVNFNKYTIETALIIFFILA